MTVLSILGLLLLLFVTVILVSKINSYSEQHYNYQFFTWSNLFFTVVSYALLYFGREWYLSELATSHGDTLNGILLLIFGFMMLAGLLLYHMKKTTLLFGFFVGLLQLLLYIPASVVSILAFIFTALWLSETKPVVNLNE